MIEIDNGNININSIFEDRANKILDIFSNGKHLVSFGDTTNSEFNMATYWGKPGVTTNSGLRIPLNNNKYSSKDIIFTNDNMILPEP
tara:strand:+ start:786 stop:1046 length:261 start_codon:yes stop_codon:yes gene_type:complete